MQKKQVFIKHDITDNWDKAINFIPKKEEIIIYDDVFPYGIKIDDGKTKVKDLPFLGDYTFKINQNILSIE